jgi:hypothetical protein
MRWDAVVTYAIIDELGPNGEVELVQCDVDTTGSAEPARRRGTRCGTGNAFSQVAECSVIFRRATASDVDSLVDIQQAGAVLALCHIFPQNLHPFPRDAIVRRWLAEIADPEIQVYVSTDDGGKGDRLRRHPFRRAPALRHRAGDLGQRTGVVPP